MKEIIYSAEGKKEVLHTDTYNGYTFYIVSYGAHPCAYVEIPKNHPWFEKDYSEIEEDISCHGGLTYSDNLSHVLGEDSKNRWFIGWDYAHCGDYSGYDLLWPHLSDNKQWTTEEILEEVKRVIDQIKNYE